RLPDGRRRRVRTLSSRSADSGDGGRTRMSGAFWGGLLFGAVVISALIIWSIRRHRDPDLHIECDRPIDELMPTLAGLTLGTAIGGNRAEVHENGAYFDVLIGRIRAARQSVHLETFLWKDG